jgi:hypothetical protein
MAQINLLRQNNSPEKKLGNITGIAVKLLVVAVFGVLGYYGFLYAQVSKINKQIMSVREVIAKEESKLSQLERRDELALRQSQLKEMEKIINSHVYWTTLLPELAKITLKPDKGYFTAVKILADGNVNVSLRSSSLEDIDKFLQAFDLPEVYKNFRNVSISSINRELVDESIERSLEVSFQYNPDLLKYNDQYTRRR